MQNRKKKKKKGEEKKVWIVEICILNTNVQDDLTSSSEYSRSVFPSATSMEN